MGLLDGFLEGADSGFGKGYGISRNRTLDALKQKQLDNQSMMQQLAQANLLAKLQGSKSKADADASKADLQEREFGLKERKQRWDEESKTTEPLFQSAKNYPGAGADELRQLAELNGKLAANPNATDYAPHGLIGREMPARDVRSMVVPRAQAKLDDAYVADRRNKSAVAGAMAGVRVGTQKLKAEEPSPAQTKDITDLDNLLGALDGISGALDESDKRPKTGNPVTGTPGRIDTGNWATLRNSLAQYVNQDDPAQSGFKAAIQQYQTLQRVAATGRAATAKEMALLAAQQPHERDAPATLREKIRISKTIISNARARGLQNSAASGKDMSQFGGPASMRPYPSVQIPPTQSLIGGQGQDQGPTTEQPPNLGVVPVAAPTVFRPKPRSAPRPGSKPGTIRVKSMKTGKSGNWPANEPLADGYELE